MILAELEVFHSRPIAPTRRVALGDLNLPATPAPGFGGLLLGGVVAAKIAGIDPELFDDLDRLTVQLERGQRIPQPRLRHRLQVDRVGLQSTRHRLVGDGERLHFDIGDKGSPAQHILAAVYAAALLPVGPRTPVMAVVRKAMRWSGGVDNSLLAYLSGLAHSEAWAATARHDPIRWALDVLGLTARDGVGPGKRAVQRRFRQLLREAHPDHGGADNDAALRISQLAEARRLLLAS